MTNLVPRVTILLSLEAGEQSYSDLLELTGLTMPSALSYHLTQLVKEGLIRRPKGGNPELTNLGYKVAHYLEVAREGETVYQRLMRSLCGGYTYAVARAIQEVADQQDARYKLERDGLRRNVRGVRELERKCTSNAVLSALKTHYSMESAAAELGVSSQVLTRRANRLFLAGQKTTKEGL